MFRSTQRSYHRLLKSVVTSWAVERGGTAAHWSLFSRPSLGRRRAPCPAISPPLCDIPSGCCFFTGPWTVTRFFPSHAASVAVFCRPLRPVFLLVSFSRWRSPVVGVLGVLIAAGVISQPLLPTPLRIQVVHHLLRCVSAGMWSVGLLFLHGALDSHPFCPPPLPSVGQQTSCPSM